MTPVTVDDVRRISSGFHPDPARSMSLRSEAYVDPRWLAAELEGVFARTWQWVCHVERLAKPGSYVATTVAGMPIAMVRDRAGVLRAFYNVCKHRAHELLSGSGITRNIVCPYHAWTYDLSGGLKVARHADGMTTFGKSEICLDQVQVEEFGGFVYVNLDSAAAPLAEQAMDLAADIDSWDVAHKEFVSLVDMATYEVETHGIWSRHFVEAGKQRTPAFDQGRIVYDTSGPGLSEHGVHHFHGLLIDAYARCC